MSDVEWSRGNDAGRWFRMRIGGFVDCPDCGEDEQWVIIARHATKRYRWLRCCDCGSVFRERWGVVVSK